MSVQQLCQMLNSCNSDKEDANTNDMIHHQDGCVGLCNVPILVRQEQASVEQSSVGYYSIGFQGDYLHHHWCLELVSHCFPVIVPTGALQTTSDPALSALSPPNWVTAFASTALVQFPAPEVSYVPALDGSFCQSTWSPGYLWSYCRESLWPPAFN